MNKSTIAPTCTRKKRSELTSADIERAFLASDRKTLARADRERTARCLRSGRAAILHVGGRYWTGVGTFTRSRERAYVFPSPAAARRHAKRLVAIGIDGSVVEAVATR